MCDLKLANIILGIQSCSSLYSCPYCEGSKVDDSGKPTNGRGQWIPGQLRTVRNISANHSEWVSNTNQNRKQLKNFKSCEFKPIPLRKDQEDVAVLFQLPPDPLHVNLLGCGNDALECIEKFIPQEMSCFYKQNNLKKSGEGPGGKFNGPSIKFILREEILCQLEGDLPEDATPFISYLRSIRSLHQLCTGRDLEDQQLILYDFSVNFNYLHDNFGLNMTMKVHIILHHYQDYFDWTGKTMRFTNGEFVESTHYSIKNEEKTHNFKVKRLMGTPKHLGKSMKSLVWHNSRRVWMTPPEKLKLRRSVHSPMN